MVFPLTSSPISGEWEGSFNFFNFFLSSLFFSFIMKALHAGTWASLKPVHFMTPLFPCFRPAFTASRPDCSRYYPLGIAPIVFSFDLLHISYLSLGNSCSQTFDEDSRIFCRSRPSWHSATWPLVWLLTFDYFILLCLLPTLWPR